MTSGYGDPGALGTLPRLIRPNQLALVWRSIAAAVGAYGAWFRLVFHNADAPQLLDQGPDRRDVRVDIAI